MHNGDHLNGNDPNGLLARIGGVWAGHDLQVQFQYEVAGLLKRTSNRFPGAQPVSFSKAHLEELKRADYYVCEKTDGMRYLLWMTTDAGRPINYLIDRKNDYYFVDGLFFPHQDSKDWTKAHEDTILDGELVEDRFPDGTTQIKFYVFDCLVIDKSDLMGRPLDKRLAYFQMNVLKPYKACRRAHPEKDQPFQLADKSNEFSYGLEKMFKETIPKVKQLHGNDGLIFTCKDSPYCPGTDPHILKWKPPEENTVDFLLHITWHTEQPDPTDADQSPIEDYHTMPQEFGLYVNYGRDQYERHGELYVSPEEWQNFKAMNRPLQDSIVECFVEDVSQQGPPHGLNGHNHSNGTNGTANGKRWRFHRFRDDKEEANHISTFESVQDSIMDRVTEEDLLRHAGEIRARWKARDAERKAARG
jgi:mRNA guanylyltransferase